MCIDVRKEPILQEVNNEDLRQEANKSKEVRLDISALNFWTTGQRAFFDVRDLISSPRDIVRWQLRSASEQMRTKRKKTMVTECCKLKMGLYSPGRCYKLQYGKRMHSVLQTISRDDCR